MTQIVDIVKRQRECAKNGYLRDVVVRKEMLAKLYDAIKTNEVAIAKALEDDLGKSEFESYLAEIDFTLHEIRTAIKKVRKWSRPKCVGSPLPFFPARSYISTEPYGTVLIIGPWNYPFQLVMAPLVAALAAGNTSVLKPSEISSNTAAVITKIISENFKPEHIAVVEGGIPETTELLDQHFDYIFYTGNGMVGRIIMEKAAKHLTPVTLELGGKSPCFVFTKNLELSAKRIVWGKYFNAGQTCVAPDYVLIKEEDIQEFINHCRKYLKKFYGEDIKSSPDYGKIVNERHFDRVEGYLQDNVEILLGGTVDKSQKYIEPTILKASSNSKVMQEEIFGPLLPVVAVSSLEDGIDYVKRGDKPLACYAFLDNGQQIDKVNDSISSGGMVFNDTLIHLTNDNLPFGGVGESGMGTYHGEFGFQTFSHKKSVMRRFFFLENDLRYPPYKGKLGFIRRLMDFIS